MSLWARAQQLPQESLQQVRAIYGDHFPIEVRHCLASWIESRIWTTEPEEQQRYFVEELVQEIQTNADLMLSPEMFVTQMKLKEAANNFRVRAIYGDHFPIEVRHCLASWIESRIWTTEPEEQQRYFVEELVQEIQTNADLMLSPEMFVTQMKLKEAANNFRVQYR
ncbi:Signal transducer and activator of transcription 5B [Papilio machaon]|uniref:Signal transducer and activator of transcription 5B n=1 Tax=Papilio machaon TaxID=76193 RepID=A0A0N1ID72_PAPMA|nr:Signal transducer and activator of transcription 5B [Papilio machaon]